MTLADSTTLTTPSSGATTGNDTSRTPPVHDASVEATRKPIVGEVVTTMSDDDDDKRKHTNPGQFDAGFMYLKNRCAYGQSLQRAPQRRSS